MANTNVHILDGSLWSNIPKFALPVAVTAILEQLFNAADIAVVGRGISHWHAYHTSV